MFDIGWTEMLVIAVIAIVVVGPKDLPRMLRTVGQYVGKAKRMAREFQTQFDDAVRDSDLDEVRKSFNDLKSSNPSGEVAKALSPLMQAADDLKSTVEQSDRDDGSEADLVDDNSILDETKVAAIPSKPGAGDLAGPDAEGSKTDGSKSTQTDDAPADAENPAPETSDVSAEDGEDTDVQDQVVEPEAETPSVSKATANA